MKSFTIYLLVFYISCLSVFNASAVFSSFQDISPKNVEALKKSVNLSVNKEDKDFFDIKIKGLKYNDVWLITVDKPLSVEEQQMLRGYIWKQEFKPAKVLKLQKLFTNKSKKRQPPLPVFTVKNIFGTNSYIYLDHPKEVQDGGYYYAIDLPKFYENQIAAPLRKKEEEAIKAAEALKAKKKASK